MKNNEFLASHRRKSRELILQSLFQIEFLNNLNLKKSLLNLKQIFAIEKEVFDFSSRIADAYDLHSDEIDNLIKTASKNWKLDRMSHVDKNILRMAVAEIMFLEDETPTPVVINESLEIAKKYSTQESASFINGILDQIAKEIAKNG
jgi:N utilization substance protein B